MFQCLDTESGYRCKHLNRCLQTARAFVVLLNYQRRVELCETCDLALLLQTTQLFCTTKTAKDKDFFHTCLSTVAGQSVLCRCAGVHGNAVQMYHMVNCKQTDVETEMRNAVPLSCNSVQLKSSGNASMTVVTHCPRQHVEFWTTLLVTDK